MWYSNDMFHYMLKAEFVTLVSLEVPSGPPAPLSATCTVVLRRHSLAPASPPYLWIQDVDRRRLGPQHQAGDGRVLRVALPQGGYAGHHGLALQRETAVDVHERLAKKWTSHSSGKTHMGKHTLEKNILLCTYHVLLFG